MRVAIATLGCKVNQYDSAVFERLFAERGWERVDFSARADAYVVNTCTVTDRADAEARRLARRARRTNPEARVVMTGCYAQVGAESLRRLAEVDYVVGLGRLEDLLAAIAGQLEGSVAVGNLRRENRITTFGLRSFPGRTRAFVKIQEGCDLFCTFCIVPLARGPSRSVPPRQVIEEVERLGAAGHREVVLTGVHLGGYGRDLNPPTSLAELLGMLAERRLDLRVRLSSIDPPEVTGDLLAAARALEGFCDHFHVPIQAGDDRVLERMRRRYTVAEARAAFERIRDTFPQANIGTDVIAGFPGETPEEFANTLAFLEQAAPGYLHVFPYSRRRSTAAAKRWQPLPERVVRGRAARLRALDRRLRRSFARRFVGKRLEVLIERPSQEPDGPWRGHSRNYLEIEIVPRAGLHRGMLVQAQVVGARGRRLAGVAL